MNNSSVTGALRSLSKKDLINYAPYEVITLTPTGKKIAKDVVRRHEILMNFFVNVLFVDEAQAEETACKMEHAVSRTILDRMISFAEFVENCPRAGESWLKGFRDFCTKETTTEACKTCLSLCLDEIESARGSNQ